MALIQNLRFALRMMRRSPGFTLIGVVTLGGGIALITVVFSLVNAFFLRPLPFAEPDQLVHVWQTDGKIGFDTLRMSVPNYEDLRRSSERFDDLGGYFYGGQVLRTDGTEATTTLDVTWMTPNLLEVLGVAPELGRGFSEEEGEVGGARVALLSHGFWRRHFGQAPDAVGKSLVLDGELYTVIGVLPERFVFPFNRMDVYLPLAISPYREDRGVNGPLLVVGRLAAGADAQTAQTELDTLMENLEQEYPESNEQKGANIVGLRSQLLFTYDMFAVVFPALLVAILFVILIVCANLGNLMLARGAERSHEMAFRLTLGASRRQLLGQLLTESGLLALVGAALGVVLAAGLARGFNQNFPGELYRVGDIEVDAAAFVFALLIAVLCTLVFGLAPALQSTRLDLAGAMKEGARGATGSLRRRRMSNALVVAQVTLAVLLVSGSVLMAKTFLSLRAVDLGFQTDRLLTLEVTLPDSKYATDPQERQYFDDAMDRVRAVPGVESVSTIYPLPLNHESMGAAFEVEGREVAPDDQLFANTVWITPEWFETASIPILEGRGFDQRDNAEAPPVVMVNRLFADRMWPNESAIGKRIQIREAWREVVGVAANTLYYELDEETPMMVFYPQSQVSTRRRFVMVRTSGEPLAARAGVEAAVAAVDSAQPIENVRSMDQVIDTWLAAWMIGIGGLGALGVGALLLAAMGLYGVIRYSVSQRVHEFGIRNALGARRGDIVRMVLSQGLSLVAVGLVIGLVLSFVLTRFLQSLLFGVDALDPVAFLATPAILLAVAALACWLPARRAVRIDPIEALRQD